MRIRKRMCLCEGKRTKRVQVSRHTRSGADRQKLINIELAEHAFARFDGVFVGPLLLLRLITSVSGAESSSARRSAFFEAQASGAFQTVQRVIGEGLGGELLP